jgi:hypothetical protein
MFDLFIFLKDWIFLMGAFCGGKIGGHTETIIDVYRIMQKKLYRY